MNNNKKQVKNIQELIEALFPSNKECYLCGYKGNMIGLIGHECKSPLEIEINKKQEFNLNYQKHLRIEKELKDYINNKEKEQ